MSSFDHSTLIKQINENLAPLRKAQPEAMQGFGLLAKASMAEGALSAKHKELMALAIGSDVFELAVQRRPFDELRAAGYF